MDLGLKVIKNKLLCRRLFNANMSVSLDGSFTETKQFSKISSDKAKLDIVKIETYNAPRAYSKCSREISRMYQCAPSWVKREVCRADRDWCYDSGPMEYARPETEYIKLGRTRCLPPYLGNSKRIETIGSLVTAVKMSSLSGANRTLHGLLCLRLSDVFLLSSSAEYRD